MLNSIKKHLDSEKIQTDLDKFMGIIILRTPEETLIKVIEEIVDELVQDLPDDAFKAKIKSTASSFIKGLMVCMQTQLQVKEVELAEDF